MSLWLAQVDLLMIYPGGIMDAKTSIHQLLKSSLHLKTEKKFNMIVQNQYSFKIAIIFTKRHLVNLYKNKSSQSKHFFLGDIWGASHGKVLNVMSCCHTKRIFLRYKKSVSYQKKGPFCMTHPFFAALACIAGRILQL